MIFPSKSLAHGMWRHEGHRYSDEYISSQSRAIHCCIWRWSRRDGCDPRCRGVWLYYNFITRNHARSTALALLEEFGLGKMEIIKALSLFPGFAGNDWMFGGVSRSLIVLGIYFGLGTKTYKIMILLAGRS
jgi:hypothetical protein